MLICILEDVVTQDTRTGDKSQQAAPRPSPSESFKPTFAAASPERRGFEFARTLVQPKKVHRLTFLLTRAIIGEHAALRGAMTFPGLRHMTCSPRRPHLLVGSYLRPEGGSLLPWPAVEW